MEPKEYYRLYPEILTHSWRNNYYAVSVFEYLIRNACDHIRTDDGQTVAEGTVVCNFDGLLQRLSYCEPILSRALKSLLYSGDITYHEIKIRGASFGIYTLTLFPRKTNQEKTAEPELPAPEAHAPVASLSEPEAHAPVASASAKCTTEDAPSGHAPHPTKSKYCPSSELQRRKLYLLPLIPTRPHIRGAPP